jgi:hypothetical protein
MHTNQHEQRIGTNESRTPQELTSAPASNVAVLICSSDGRRDILQRVLPSLFKYWPDCPYPIYAGLNTDYELGPNITTLLAPPSEWRKECFEQIAQIPETHLIVVLDDFLFQKPVDQSSLSRFVFEAINSKLPYLRLLPLGKSMLERLFNSNGIRSVVDIRAIKEGRPFYSGLQIAIWNKAHLLSMLKSRGSIWDFEHKRKPGAAHYVITGRPPIVYSHLVEKGRWLPHARSLLREAGLPTDLGTRPIWPKWMNLRLMLDKVRFHVIGYANH